MRERIDANIRSRLYKELTHKIHIPFKDNYPLIEPKSEDIYHEIEVMLPFDRSKLAKSKVLYIYDGRKATVSRLLENVERLDLLVTNHFSIKDISSLCSNKITIRKSSIEIFTTDVEYDLIIFPEEFFSSFKALEFKSLLNKFINYLSTTGIILIESNTKLPEPSVFEFEDSGKLINNKAFVVHSQEVDLIEKLILDYYIAYDFRSQKYYHFTKTRKQHSLKIFEKLKTYKATEKNFGSLNKYFLIEKI